MGADTKEPHRHIRDTDGGEEQSHPRRARRLVDIMAGSPPKRPRGAEGADCSNDGGKDSPRLKTAESLRRSMPPSVPNTGSPAHQPLPVHAAALSADRCAVLSIYPEGEGGTVAVTLAVPSSLAEAMTAMKAGRGTPPDGNAVKVRIHLLVEQYRDLNLHAGEISPEEADAILEAGRLCTAIRRGLNLLRYGDQSARRLTDKLTAKGTDREIAAQAVAYLQRRGYIREESTARLRAEQGVRKLWGPMRIREDLRAKGFTEEVAEEVLEELSEVDWVENCAAAIHKKYGDIPAELNQRQKLIAAVMRLGYTSDTVKEAMRILLRETT